MPSFSISTQTWKLIAMQDTKMASSFHCLLFCSLVIFFQMIISPTLAKTSFRPRVLVLPIAKDSSPLQHLTTIMQRNPLVRVKLTLDLGSQFLWVDFEQGFVSSTSKPVSCDSTQCTIARSKSCYMDCST